MKQPLAIGVDNYKDIIEKPYYYVDKTLLIRDLWDAGGKVSLFTRPRRFGKTLALSMLRTFFEKEITYDGQVVDNSRYFSGKRIMEAGARYTDCLGKYPVIALSLKSAKQPSFEMAYRSIVDEISKEYDRHSYVLGCDRISHDDQEKFKAMRGRRAEAIDYAKALEFLSVCLQKYHGEKTIILIDEYDVPLENAYFSGFYEQMIQLIRSLFESALKTNENLQFAVVTGCLRISKESIFTGLNNLEIISILNDNYAEYFGFTAEEVMEMLDFYDIPQKAEEAKEWYDGYLFGDTEVYNPWSMINYVKTAVTNRIAYPQPYWSNTSSNGIIREMVEHAGIFMRSNREAGNGRPDIQLVSYDLDIPAIIIEIKKADAYTQMEEQAQEALQQMEDRKYDEELRLEGYHNFLHYGISFCKKNCCVRVKRS